MSRIETKYGRFEAHPRREQVDIERNGNLVASYPKTGVVENLRGRRRFAEFLSGSASKLKAPVVAGVVGFDAGLGLVKGENKRVLRGLVLGAVIAVALGHVETVFQKDADLSGIHQEAIEEA